MVRFPGYFFLQNLIERRNLLWQLVRRDFQQRFVGSIVGWIWGLIHPLVMLFSWVFVFQWALGVRLPAGEVTENYPLYLFAGFLPWLLFQETLQRSATCLPEHANLITKTIFPSEMIPVSVFLSSLAGHLMALVLVVAAIGIWERHISASLLLLPVHMLWLGLLAIGFAWIVAGLQVYLRDTAQILSVLMTVWFWLTPIFIAERQYPEPVRFLLVVNPLAHLVRAYRERLLSNRWPGLEEVVALGVVSMTVFGLGGLFFRHLKRGFADVL